MVLRYRTALASITLTATSVYDTIDAWRRTFRCAIRWLTGREILVRLRGFHRRNALHRSTHGAADDGNLAGIEKETVNFNPNYDESLSEPSVLPTGAESFLERFGRHRGRDGDKDSAAQPDGIVDATIALIRKRR